MHPLHLDTGRLSRPARGLRLARLVRAVLTLGALRRQRRRLAEMDDILLDDIGVSPDQARAEAARPVWDVPPTWRL